MCKKDMNSQSINEDIDFLNILDFFWKNKIKIISVVILFLIIGYVINTIFPQQYIATTEIKKIKEQSHLPYSLYVKQSAFNYQVPKDVDETAVIVQQQYYKSLRSIFTTNHGRLFTRDNLLISYVDELSDLNHLENFFSKNLHDEKFFTNFDTYKVALRESANNLKINVKRKKDNFGNKSEAIENITIEYRTSNKNDYIKALIELSNATTEKVRLSKINQSKKIIKDYQDFKKIKIREIDRELKSWRLTNRDNRYLEELERVKFLLIEDGVEKDIEQYILKSPLSSKQSFIAVDFNPYATKFKETRSHTTLLIMLFLVGLVAGTLYAIVSRSET